MSDQVNLIEFSIKYRERSSFLSYLRSFYIIARFVLDSYSIFAQLIIFCGSQRYISLIDRSMKNRGVTGTSNI